MIIGQDGVTSDTSSSIQALDSPTNPTNIALQKLVSNSGLRLPEPPTAGAIPDARSADCGIWLTNALFWLKTGGLSAKVHDDWFGDEAARFLKVQIDIVQPRVIIALGQRAYDLALFSYGLPKRRGPFHLVVGMQESVVLPPVAHAVRLIGGYHCGVRVQNTLRSLTKQKADWACVQVALQSA